MAKLITRFGFDQMDRDQFNAFFEFMDFTKNLQNKLRSRAKSRSSSCERQFTFESVVDDLGSSNVIPFKGENYMIENIQTLGSRYASDASSSFDGVCGDSYRVSRTNDTIIMEDVEAMSDELTNCLVGLVCA